MLRPAIFSVALVCGGFAAAQCQFSTLATQFVGTHCNIGSTGCCALPGHPTQLIAQLDVATCSLSFEVAAVSGCCSVTVPLRVLAIGTTRANVPLPQFGAGCTLWLAPTDFLVVGATPLMLPIPPTLPPLTFMAQGAAVVADPFAPVPLDTTLTAGYAVTLQ